MKTVHLGWTIGVHQVLLRAVTVWLCFVRRRARPAAKEERTFREIQGSRSADSKTGVFQQPLARWRHKL
jgi:hypothetical protein